jgi:ubiquinol-cytochrome c reductase cytochrome b subunit
VFANFRNWLDHRTGYRRVMSVLLIEHIPGGARWRYVWGSCLAFVFTIQLITGLLLMTAYSPGAGAAWSSVHFIQYEMDFGWLIRGLHHFGSQTMVVLLGLHMLQVVIAGAHLPPREVNWWLGLILLGLVLALSLTGYLLPWDQKGYYATQVATNIAGNLPGVGHWLQKIIVGGPEYGNHTLTRFYALHVAILPPLVIIFIVLHLVVFRRHGVAAPKQPPPGSGENSPEPVEGWFWPDQAFRDLIVSLVIFGIMVGLVVYGHGNKIELPEEQAAHRTLYDKVAHAGLDGKGANLDAPADPSVSYDPRPEWYFLFLFQLLKYFEGHLEVVGTVIIPNGTLLLLAILPLLGYGRMRRFGHVFGVLVVTALLTSVAALTSLAVAEDMVNPVGRKVIKLIGLGVIPLAAAFLLLWLGLLSLLNRGGFRTVVRAMGTLVLLVLLGGAGYLGYGALSGKKIPPFVADQVEARMPAEDEKALEKAEKYREDQEKADKLAERAAYLAHTEGVPAAGSTGLLRRDPLTRGPELFALKCGICHNYRGLVEDTKERKATASDLNGFGTEEWIFRLLKNPGHDNFFGRTGKSDMQDFIESNFGEDKDKEVLRPLARWLASHPRDSSKDKNSDWFKEGLARFTAKGNRNCNRCHSYEGKGGTSSTRGPDLTGYGDEEWLREMIMMPHSSWRYGVNNTMPIFRDLEGPTGNVIKLEIEASKQAMAANPKNKNNQADINKAHTLMQLSDVERELIIRWLLRDYRLVFGGEPLGAAIRP